MGQTFCTVKEWSPSPLQLGRARRHRPIHTACQSGLSLRSTAPIAATRKVCRPNTTVTGSQQVVLSHHPAHPFHGPLAEPHWVMLLAFHHRRSPFDEKCRIPRCLILGAQSIFRSYRIVSTPEISDLTPVLDFGEPHPAQSEPDGRRHRQQVECLPDQRVTCRLCLLKRRRG